MDNPMRPPAPPYIKKESLVPLIDHVILTVSDLEKSRVCYGWLLPLLGYGVRHNMGDFTGWFREKRERAGQIWIKKASVECATAKFNKDSPGLCELAFSVDGRETVEEIARGLSAHGFLVTNAPTEYDYVPGYYSVFFLDPDGIKLEIVARGCD